MGISSRSDVLLLSFLELVELNCADAVFLREKMSKLVEGNDLLRLLELFFPLLLGGELV